MPVDWAEAAPAMRSHDDEVRPDRLGNFHDSLGGVLATHVLRFRGHAGCGRRVPCLLQHLGGVLSGDPLDFF